jgi:hypothetical protein
LTQDFKLLREQLTASQLAGGGKGSGKGYGKGSGKGYAAAGGRTAVEFTVAARLAGLTIGAKVRHARARVAA